MNKTDLRILFLGTQMEVAGAQKMLLSQADWFHRRGYPVQVVFFYDKQSLAAEWQARHEFPIRSLGAWRYAGFSLFNYLRAIGGMLRLWKMMRANVDVIVSYTPHSNVLGMFVAWLAAVPLRLPTHHGYIEGSSRMLARVHGWMVNAGLASKLVAVSEQVRAYALDQESVQAQHIAVIENGIEDPIEHKLSAREKDALRKEIGVQKGQSLFLTTGRLTVQKGHTVLLKAIAMEKERLSKVFFAFAGDGAQRGKLEAEARELGLADQVRFLGIRKDVSALLQAADLFVQPSLWEGLSLAMLEALFAGCPVLATRVEGVVDVITDGQTGTLVEAGDPAALAEAMLRLLEDESLRKSLAQAGERHARGHYSVERMCGEYEDLVADLAAAKDLVKA